MLQLTVLACCFLSSAPAHAMPRLGRESDGVILSVDRETKMLTIIIEGTSRRFQWDKQTRFIQNQEFANPDILEAGAAVRIYYHVPFFGKPFVTKVTLLRSPRREHGR